MEVVIVGLKWKRSRPFTNRLACSSDRPRILCGDFNAPQAEMEDGTIVTWAQKVRPDNRIIDCRTIDGCDAKRWDSAERNIFDGLRRFDLCDTYRSLSGYSPTEFSYFVNRKDGRGPGRRFDHVLHLVQ